MQMLKAKSIVRAMRIRIVALKHLTGMYTIIDRQSENIHLETTHNCTVKWSKVNFLCWRSCFMITSFLTQPKKTTLFFHRRVFKKGWVAVMFSFLSYISGARIFTGDALTEVACHSYHAYDISRSLSHKIWAFTRDY